MYRMLIYFFLGALFVPSAEGSWQVNSEFELHLTESTFDKIVEDFWENLKGKQTVELGSLSVDQGVPVSIDGIHAELDYAFQKPQRTTTGRREWELVSERLAARLRIDRISATQIIERDIGGIIVKIRLEADCRNVVLNLPQGLTNTRAKIRADILQNQVRLGFSEFSADWGSGAWEVESLSCTGAQGFEQIVADEALKALASFKNFDQEVRNSLSSNFEIWSKDISLLLLSDRELPSNRDYLKVFYEPYAIEDSSDGVMLRGQLRFDYPYVSPYNDLVQEYFMEKSDEAVAGESPELVIPFAAVRALMMGEYFAGKLEYSLRSYEVPAFQSLMHSRWKQFFGWPDLMSFKKNTTFFFQFLPMGPPAFTKEVSAGDGAIAGDLTLPLAIRMYAPIKNVYEPYVEFRTMVKGHTNLRLADGGKVKMQVEADKFEVRYRFAQAYRRKYDPSTYIAVGTMADAARETLNVEGFELAIPVISIGKALKLTPKKWNLQGQTLHLDFTTGH